MPDSSESHTLDLQPSSSSTSTSKLYTSTPFKFVVEGNAFYMHAAVISRDSRPLDRMMNGDMSEAQKGYAVLEDVDEGTFGRFAEWAYERYYTPGEIILRSLDNPTPERSVVKEALEPTEEFLLPSQVMPIHSQDGWGFAQQSLGGKDRKKRGKRDDSQFLSLEVTSRDQLKESFIHRKVTVRRDSISIPPPYPNQRPEEDYTYVFLSHAQLYVFAEKYDIQKLRTLALENLQNVLAIFKLYEERTGDIITLLKYIYENTTEPIDDIEDLRTLLTHYVGYEMDTLMKDEAFRDLMIADGGALLGDFMKMVMKRIS
ncbi:MAG: hypothetical protein Q9171_002223 [Xanthocarpia ochracea]